MEINCIFNEPCLDTLSRMPDKFLDCVITSPPYWMLRDYKYDGQWGLEPSFREYLEHLWELMDEIHRCLKDTGTAWINLGDTYSTQSGTNMALTMGRYHRHQSTYLENRGESDKLIKPKGLPNKTLLLLPHRFAIGCMERNIDNGFGKNRNWIVRNDIVWAKRNGMPESVTDRFSKKHEYFFFMVKSEKYYFDLSAVKRPLAESSKERIKYNFGHSTERQKEARKINGKPIGDKSHLNGSNPGSVSDFWDIPTKSSGEQHYASYNDSLLIKPMLAGCPENGLVYDPFMGTGSTAEVAIRAKRNFIGSEMSKPYCEIANKRLAPYLKQTVLF